MNPFSRAAATVTSALRRKGNAGNLYAPNGTGSWQSVFQVSSRSTGQVRMTEQERLQSNVGVVHAATNRIAEDVSSLKVTVETWRRKGSKWLEDDTHPLNTLLDNPCMAMDGVSLRHVLQQHLCLLGRAALLVVDGTGGEPMELHVLYPQRLDAIPDPVEFVSEYRYLSLSGQQQYFPAFQTRPNPLGVGVLECRVPDPTNPYAGNSIVQAGSNSITLDSEVRAYGRFYFANNAMPGAVLESKEPYPGVDVAKAQRESWNEAYQGVYNAGKIATLWNGLSLRSTAPAFKELDFPNITKATRQDILMHFGVPGPILGYSDTGALGADVFKGAQLIYQAQTLDPHRKRLERLLNRLASRWPGVRVVIESPVEDDIAAIEARQLTEAQNGLISREEYRNARQYDKDTQPEVWMLPATSKVLHGLKPEDVAPAPDPAAEPAGDPPPDPVTTKALRERASLVRSLWSWEYSRAKSGQTEDVEARWLDQCPALAGYAAVMRQRALEAAGGNVAQAYEALKAESKTLAALEAPHG